VSKRRKGEKEEDFEGDKPVFWKPGKKK